MRALVFEGPNRLRLREVPRPAAAAGEVLVRVHTAAICGTDLRIISGRKTRDVRVGYPIGHECSGTVAEIGQGVTCCQPGDRVAICVVVSCGQCSFCAADKENLCHRRITLGYHTDGAFAEYMLIPAHAVSRGNVFLLPEQVSIETAPLLEPMACCLNGQHEMDLGRPGAHLEAGRGESLVIFGAGPIGLLHLLLARARGGVDRITVVEPRENRRAMASRLGADSVCGPEEFSALDEYDAAICAVGAPAVVPAALRAAGKLGKLNFFAGFDQGLNVSLDPNQIHYKQLRITGASESRRRDFAEALTLTKEGKVDTAPLLTHRFPLHRFEEAFATAADGSALKVAFDLYAP